MERNTPSYCSVVGSTRSVGKANLTVRNFTDLVDEQLKMPLAKLIDKAVQETKFARDWRNRLIAHRDLSLALEDSSAEPIQPASKTQVDTALARLSDIINAVGNHYLHAHTAFSAAARHNGALTLLYLLGDGLKEKSEREKRIEQGEIRENDIPEQI